MYLASSLVARVSILGGTTYYNQYPFRFAVRHARITQIYRHLIGPDSRHRIGDIVNIVDKQPMVTGVFLDDPPLDEGSNIIIFLTAVKGYGPLAAISGLHVPTLPHISKVGVDRSGFMYVAGSTGSEMAAQINSRQVGSLQTILVPNAAGGEMNAATAWNEADVIHRLLRDRGIASSTDLVTYQASMTSNPGKVIRWAVSHDIRTNP